jgi:hypothetical protein
MNTAGINTVCTVKLLLTFGKTNVICVFVTVFLSFIFREK